MNEICCLFMFLITKKMIFFLHGASWHIKNYFIWHITQQLFTVETFYSPSACARSSCWGLLPPPSCAMRMPFASHILLPTLLHFKSQQSSRRWFWRGRKKWTFIRTAASCRFCHRKVRHLLELLQTRCVCDIWRYYLWSVDQNYGEWAWVLGTSFRTGKSLTRTHELFDSIFQLSFKWVECCVWNGTQLNRQKIN